MSPIPVSNMVPDGADCRPRGKLVSSPDHAATHHDEVPDAVSLAKVNGDRRHIPAAHHSKLADAVAAIDASRAHVSIKRALRLLVLTATRRGASRGVVDLRHRPRCR